MSRRRHAEEHAHHERWLVSYADFMTLLFALFVVLFASSHHDKKTIQSVSNAVRNGFQQMGSFSSSNGSPALSPSDMAKPAHITPAANGAAGIDVVELQRKLTQALGKEIQRQEIVMRMTPEGFVISLHELGFFNSGEATLQPGAGDKIKRIASVLMQYGLDMRVEGHSDNVPIHTAAFASNWELSTARAMAVTMMLLKESAVDPKLLSVAGYGQYRPAASNDTPEGRRANRRVDIVVVSTASPIPAKPPYDRPLNVLLVEDNSLDALLFREMFSKEPPGSIEMTHLMRMQDAVAHLERGGVDIVLLDMGLPDAHGLDTIRRARTAAPGVPMIVLTGLDDEALAAEAMKEGAQDYLIKGQIENRALPRALRYAIERFRMQAEANLLQVQQLQYKDEFLSHVSHELRSPLFAIYQFITLLLDNLAGEIKPEQRQYLEIVLRNVRQLQFMIDDLLEVTRAQAGKLTIDLQCSSIAEATRFVVDTLQGAANAKHITLSADLQSSLPPVWADPKRIRQILIILLDNAIKFTPPNGSVRVRAYAGGNPNSQPGVVTMEVADSGCGISPGLNERIFDRLFQVADASASGRKGLGLGLHICKELVTRQGGAIRAVNAPGHGAVFSVTLPIFSLANLIAPVFCEKGNCADPFMLVIAEAASKAGWLSDESRIETCNSIRATLQQCLYADSDILLPRMSSAGSSELFFLVAATDQVGAEALIKRILKQLADPEHLELADVTFTMAHRTLDRIGRLAGESIEACSQRAAAAIQHIMNQEISLRVAKSV